MRARVFVSAPGVSASFDGSALHVLLREDPTRGVLLLPTRSGWEVRDVASGARLGDLQTLDEAAVSAAGLRSVVSRLMRGAVEASKQVEGEPEAEGWTYMEARPGEGASEIPLDALSQAGAEGWRVVDVWRTPSGGLGRVLFARRLS